ncbi:hypothetical protein QFZ68_004041 [Streptomyces sp. V1I6]|nr:hypothetical protein [Streptomyces sp. V1I6]
MVPTTPLGTRAPGRGPNSLRAAEGQDVTAVAERA